MLHLFQAFGVELEYMIVDAETLDVRPISDQVLRAVRPTDADEDHPSEVESDRGISWSNELVLHVLELKTTEPTPTFHDVPGRMLESVQRINELLKPMNARLMPAAMHPWMNPDREMKLWPHSYGEFYATFNRIFDCRGHGWANLQSVHLNLPFSGDDEFGRLHAAIRLILPILPAICASSPMIEGRITGLMDNRLDVYQHNARKVPSVSGRTIPEPVYTQADYQRVILERIYADLAPHDPEGMLRHEWANARGAIARFERDAIEIRVMDVQECPAADTAICTSVTGVLQAIVGERWAELASQQAWDIDTLHRIFVACVRDAEQAVIREPAYLNALGMFAKECTARELWQHLIACTRPVSDEDAGVRGPIEHILARGPLSRRILRAVTGSDKPEPGTAPDPQRVRAVYRTLCECLAAGRMFDA
jgi:gamma-glutamyl:cysteine ligase YbdK (ATP-grasp superfamily)